MADESWIPPDPPSRTLSPQTVIAAVPRNPWPAAIQNILALAAVVTLTLSDKINGNTASVMILAIIGVIALPAVMTKGKTGLGSVGIFALVAKPAITLAIALLPRTVS